MKTVTLSTKSPFSWYYKLVMGKLPKSLCPYFWTMLIIVPLSPIILTFIGIKRLVKWIGRKLTGKPKPELTFEQEMVLDQKRRKVSKKMETVGKIFLGFVALFYGSILIYGIFKGVSAIGLLMFLVYVFAVIGFLGTFFYCVFKFFENEIGDKILDSNFVQIPVQSISGWYNRNCPLINWK